jgi:ribosomal protein S18 acetylase RimI-like enzyme
LLPPRLRGRDTDDWDFQYIAAPPPDTPGEQAVDWLPDAAKDILDLLVSSSPRHDVKPGEPHVRRWAGVRGPDGALLACAADTRRVSTGTALLASIATAPAARRQGFGAAVTAWLTRRILAEGDRICTLGLYADNEPAKRLYRRLGYQQEHHFTSGQFDLAGG